MTSPSPRNGKQRAVELLRWLLVPVAAVLAVFVLRLLYGIAMPPLLAQPPGTPVEPLSDTRRWIVQRAFNLLIGAAFVRSSGGQSRPLPRFTQGSNLARTQDMETNMDRNAGSVERWSETRRRERSRYIWRYGVLGWGLSVGIIWALVMSALQGWERLPILLPLALIGFPMGGYFFGVCTWRMSAAHREQASRSASETQHQAR